MLIFVLHDQLDSVEHLSRHPSVGKTPLFLQKASWHPLLKKTELTTGSSFGSSAISFKRPAAFRPLLTEGLALSGEFHLLKNTA